MTSKLFIGLVSALLLCGSVQASPSIDELQKCLSDNTTGKDRKDLARWIFVGMSAHPEIGTIAKASPQDTEAVQRTTGQLFTRLIADQCPNQMRAVVQSDGNQGLKIAFEYLGRIAMQELMSNQQVAESIGGFERYAEKAKIERVIK